MNRIGCGILEKNARHESVAYLVGKYALSRKSDRRNKDHRSSTISNSAKYHFGNVAFDHV
jgi:hypothetical protein